MQNQNDNAEKKGFNLDFLKNCGCMGRDHEEESVSSMQATPKIKLQNVEDAPIASFSSFSNGDWADVEEISQNDNFDVNGGYQPELYETIDPIDFDYLKAIIDEEDGVQDADKSFSSGLSKDSKKINKDKPAGGSSKNGSPVASPKKAAQKAAAAGQKGKRNPWQPHEDAKLLELVAKHGQSWALLATLIEGRTGKQIRDRYLNILRPNIKKGDWTPQEDQHILALYYQFGHKWSKISSFVPGRTEGQVKNRFYAHIKRKILDPQGLDSGNDPQGLMYAKNPNFRVAPLSTPSSQGQLFASLSTTPNASAQPTTREFMHPANANTTITQGGMPNQRSFTFPAPHPVMGYPNQMGYAAPQNQVQGYNQIQYVPIDMNNQYYGQPESLPMKARSLDPSDLISYDRETLSRLGTGDSFQDQPIQSPDSVPSTQASDLADEKAVDMALDRMANFFQKKGSQEMPSMGYRPEELLNIQSTGLDKVERVDQLHKRRTMLEFMLQKTMEEMHMYGSEEMQLGVENF